MKKAIISILAFALILCLSGFLQADIVDISVATDKTTYQVGEEVKIFVSAYNPSLDSVRLTFGTPIQASYWMDETYYGHVNLNYPQIQTHVTINSNSTHTWHRIHGIDGMQEYPLELGIHTVAGVVGAYELMDDYLTEPVEFEVIPEPSSLLLLTTGCVYLFRRKKCNGEAGYST
jgi:hypothetical protein